MNPGRTLIGIAVVLGAVAAARWLVPGGFGFDAYAQPAMMHGGMIGHKPWMNDSDWHPRRMRKHRGPMAGMGGWRGMGSIDGKLPPIAAAALPAAGSAGAGLMAAYCTQCHNLPSPAMHSRDDWPTILDRMYRRLDKTAGWSARRISVKAPNGEEKQRLAAYVVAHAMRPYDPAAASPADSPESAMFRNTCGQCHGLPAPDQHTASEWPGVVARMKTNAKNMNRPMPDADGIGQIVPFLQAHARKS